MKNISVSKKLWSILLPMVLILTVFLIFFIYITNSIQDNFEKVLYQEMYISSTALLNADRDFYQASIAEKELILDGNISSERKTTLLKEYDDNVKQTKERVAEAVDNVKENDEIYLNTNETTSGMNMESLYSEFQKYILEWENAYDVKMGTGDISRKVVSFGKTRKQIDLMSGVFELYAEQKIDDIRRETKSSIIVIAIIVGMVVFSVFIFASIIIRYISKSIQGVTGNMDELANNNLTFLPYYINN